MRFLRELGADVQMNRPVQMCRPFRLRFSLSSVTTRSRAWLPSDSSQNSWFCKLLPKQATTPVFGNGGPLFTAGASRLVSLYIRSSHKAGNDFQTSLEEAAVNRPGRKAGRENTHRGRAPRARHIKDAEDPHRGGAKNDETSVFSLCGLCASAVRTRPVTAALGAPRVRAVSVWRTCCPRSRGCFSLRRT